MKDIVISGAREGNLKNISLRIPREKLVVLTGVSGSGKSSLVNEILYKSLAKKLNRARTIAGAHDGIDGVDQLDKIIAIDSHIDTVGIGNRENWTNDPYEGYETDDIIYGRGGSDQEGGMAAATYGVKIMKEQGLIPAGYKIMVVGSVQEEDCDGMCWQSIVNEYFNGPEDARSKIEFVISTEPTDGGIYRGHRGRMEIRVVKTVENDGYDAFCIR